MLSLTRKGQIPDHSHLTLSLSHTGNSSSLCVFLHTVSTYSIYGAWRRLGREHMGPLASLEGLCGLTWLRSRCSRCRDLAALRKAAAIPAR